LADALAQSSAGRGAVSGAIIGGAVGGRRGAAVGAATGAIVGATAALARPLLLAPWSLLGPDIKRKITSGSEPILPLIDIGRGISATEAAMNEKAKSD